MPGAISVDDAPVAIFCFDFLPGASGLRDSRVIGSVLSAWFLLLVVAFIAAMTKPDPSTFSEYVEQHLIPKSTGGSKVGAFMMRMTTGVRKPTFTDFQVPANASCLLWLNQLCFISFHVFFALIACCQIKSVKKEDKIFMPVACRVHVDV